MFWANECTFTCACVCVNILLDVNQRKTHKKLRKAIVQWRGMGLSVSVSWKVIINTYDTRTHEQVHCLYVNGTKLNQCTTSQLTLRSHSFDKSSWFQHTAVQSFGKRMIIKLVWRQPHQTTRSFARNWKQNRENRENTHTHIHTVERKKNKNYIILWFMSVQT